MQMVSGSGHKSAGTLAGTCRRGDGAPSQRPPIYKSVSKTSGKLGNDFGGNIDLPVKMLHAALLSDLMISGCSGGGGAYELAIWGRNFHLGSLPISNLVNCSVTLDERHFLLIFCFVSSSNSSLCLCEWLFDFCVHGSAKTPDGIVELPDARYHNKLS